MHFFVLYKYAMRPVKTILHVVFNTKLKKKLVLRYEISSSHGGEYDVQNCLLGCTAV
jgi:hypothetical protein